MFNLNKCLCAGLFVVHATMAGVVAETSLDAGARHAYSANTGWINAAGDGTHGLTVSANICAGYAFSGNIGWICFGDGTPTNGFRYSNAGADDWGVNRDEAGHLSGHAYSANAGWLTLEPTHGQPQVDPYTGQMSGSIWAANLGWISLSNLYSSVRTVSVAQGADADADGLPDWWEYQFYGATNAPGSSGKNDADGDGLDNEAEMRAGTDPTSAGSVLAVEVAAPAAQQANGVVLSWPSVAGRSYTVLVSTNLMSAWTIEASGLHATPPMNVHTASPAVANGYLRIQLE